MKRPENFRDMGGIVAADGRRVKEKRLLRSGEVCQLNAQDKAELEEQYGLKTIVDLRTMTETQTHPDDALPGVRYTHIDIIENAEEQAASFENFEQVKTVEQAHAFMMKTYEVMTLDHIAQQGFGKLLREMITQTEHSLLFHCFAGKDRTGLGAAYLLTLLDVPREAIFEDYMKTNEMREQANNEIRDQLRAYGKSEQEVEIINITFLVRPEYLQYAIDIAEREYGTLKNYIMKTMDITEEDIVSLKENYLI